MPWESSTATICDQRRPALIRQIRPRPPQSTSPSGTTSPASAVSLPIYEAGNRSRPIAEKDFTIAPNQQLKLDTIFSNLGLDSADRRKDRANVQLVVTATAGGARVAASAVSIDNQSGDTKMVGLAPVVGSGNPNINFAAPVVTEQPPAAPTRRRGVRH